MRAWVICQPPCPARLRRQLAELGAEVSELPMVDRRGAEPLELLRAGEVTPGGYLSLLHGRCSDPMLPSSAAVGCHRSHTAACALAAAQPQGTQCLVLEEDCDLRVPALREALAALRKEEQPPDLVAFGAMLARGCERDGRSCREGDGAVGPAGTRALRAGEAFILAHCLLWTPEGARKALPALQRPVELQVDATLSLLAYDGTGLRLWWTKTGARQVGLRTSIQDLCVTCHLRGGHAVLALAVALALLVVCVFAAVRRCA